MKVSSNNYPWA